MSHISTKHPRCADIPTISEGEDLRAQICECETVQVHLGPMSLRFTEKSFERYLRFLEKVWLKLESAKEKPAEPEVFARMLAGDEA